jgi:hypothetical protein
MAVKWMSYIWEERTDLKGAELLLAVAIADHADAEGKCNPGIRSLCQKMRLQERQVQDLIKRLEKKNVFDVERGIGRGHLTAFRFKRVQVSAPIKAAEKVQETTPFSKKKGAGFCTERVQVSASPPQTPHKDCNLNTEPLREPGERTPKPEGKTKPPSTVSLPTSSNGSGNALAGGVVGKTEEILNIRLNQPVQVRITQVIPAALERDWLEMVRNRGSGIGNLSDSQKNSKVAYWLDDFTRLNKKTIETQKPRTGFLSDQIKR